VVNLGAVSKIGQLADMPLEDFKKECEYMNMGYVRGLENLLSVTFNNLCSIRKDLVSRAESKRDSGGNSEELNTLSDIYIKMISIEGKIFALRDIQKKRTLDLAGERINAQFDN
jgi:hypothetical protein